MKKCSKKNRNKFEIVNDDDVAFRMLRSNESILEEELNELRAKRRKFICLNDNFEHSTNSTRELNLRQILNNFYTSIFPLRSKFEHPPGKLNEFLYIEQYRHLQSKQKSKQSNGHFLNCSYLFLFINIFLLITMLII